jgi:hypothetical protein
MLSLVQKKANLIIGKQYYAKWNIRVWKWVEGSTVNPLFSNMSVLTQVEWSWASYIISVHSSLVIYKTQLPNTLIEKGLKKTPTSFF